jgi:succinoglycan biosynthesis protein ExoO
MDFTVSVIMPCYNAGRWVAAALLSAAQQTLPCHEIVVIDDGSKDDSLDQIAASGIPVKLIKTTNANAAGARNIGIEAASGNWIAFLDADDTWYSHHLKRAAELLSGRPDVAYLAHCDLLVHESEQVATTPPYSVGGPLAGLNDRDFLKLWAERTHFPNGGVVARRDRAIEVGLFDSTQVRRHDFELFMRIVKDHSWAYDPRPGWRYRAGTPDAISRNIAECSYYSLRAVLNNEPAYRGPEMDRLVSKYARSAMSEAFLHGSDLDRRRAWGLAKPHLGFKRKMFYGAFGRFPKLYPLLHRAARGA